MFGRCGVYALSNAIDLADLALMGTDNLLRAIHRLLLTFTNCRERRCGPWSITALGQAALEVVWPRAEATLSIATAALVRPFAGTAIVTA